MLDVSSRSVLEWCASRRSSTSSKRAFSSGTSNWLWYWTRSKHQTLLEDRTKRYKAIAHTLSPDLQQFDLEMSRYGPRSSPSKRADANAILCAGHKEPALRLEVKKEGPNVSLSGACFVCTEPFHAFTDGQMVLQVRVCPCI